MKNQTFCRCGDQSNIRPMILTWILACKTLSKIDENSVDEVQLGVEPGSFIVRLRITAGVRSNVL